MMERYAEAMMKSLQPAPNRRTFLKMSAATAGAALVIGLSPHRAKADGAGAADMFNPFVKVTPEGRVIVMSKHLDMGQGTANGLATLVADEMDAAADQIGVDFAPSDPEVYKNFAFGAQGTGGSTAIANSFDQYRQAGATARAMLVAAAAAKWGVPAGEITIENGVLSHPSGASSGFGPLVADAMSEAVPADVAVKDPADWIYIGKHFPRVDSAAKSTGSIGMFGLDHQPENGLVAVVARPPRFGATVTSFDATAARAVNGVVDVVEVPRGVAVIATATWPAIKGRDALTIEWDGSAAETRGTDEIAAEFTDLAGTPGALADNRGDADAGLAGAARREELTYVFPYLAHAPMEPLDITILYDGASATIWTGCQSQTFDHMALAQTLSLQPANVSIVTRWAGGSFGRRGVYNSHYAVEAAEIAKAFGKAQPIKVVWTREDDLTGGYYRPLYVHKVALGFDNKGALTGWKHRIAGQSMWTGTPLESFLVHDGIDLSSVEGIQGTPYALADFRVELHSPQVGVPTLWWRSVGHSHTAYAMETAIDVAASAAKTDPVAFRRELLAGDARLLGVLDLVAEKSGWGGAVPDGRHRGIAVHRSFGTAVAEVAEISMANGEVKVEKVWCAVDCGVPVNPDNIAAQMEGAIGYGLSAVLRNEITMTDGRVDQTNFDSYNPLRMEDMPEVEVHIVPSTEAPSGAGEPGLPPIGPAVANAIFAATGKMPTVLPFSKTGLAS